MATVTGTNVYNNAGNGYMVADGFLGTPSTTDVNNNRLSTQPAQFPNGQTVTGTTMVSGAYKTALTTVAAAGATQGTATAIAAGATLVNVTVTASTEGVKLPTAATGLELTLLTPTTKGYKVYTAAAGQVINAATTATTAYAMTTNHPATFFAISATAWRVQRGN